MWEAPLCLLVSMLQGSQEEKARDANFANELVMKQRENADMVKNVRERERARFDEKLQAKLAERKVGYRPDHDGIYCTEIKHSEL